MLAYGRGRWAVSQKRIQIQPVPCEPSFFTASPKALLGSFSNDDDDGGDSNDSAKKRNGFVKQNNNLARASRFFVHFFAVKWKCLISRFVEDANKRRRIFLSLSKLECGRQEIKSREIRLHLTFSADWNKRDNVWKSANTFSKWRFRCRRRRRC